MFCHRDKSRFRRDSQADEKRSDLVEIFLKVLEVPKRLGKAFFGSVYSLDYDFDNIGRKTILSV
jgi:hypothetical protein